VVGLSDFRQVARGVCNWGRWGDDDELGTLNFITAEKVAQAASLVRHGKVLPLGVDFGSAGPQGAFKFRHNSIHVMTVDGGDAGALARYGPDWARNATAQQLSGWITSRGVLLDVVRHRGSDSFLELGNPITPEELNEVARSQDVTIGRGDIIVVHTGWWARFLRTGNGSQSHCDQVGKTAMTTESTEPLVVGVGGTLRSNSSTERALRSGHPAAWRRVRR
jgi:Putative cyclase